MPIRLVFLSYLFKQSPVSKLHYTDRHRPTCEVGYQEDHFNFYDSLVIANPY